MILWRVTTPNRFYSTFTTLVTLPMFFVVFYTLPQGSSDNISLLFPTNQQHRKFFNIMSSGLLRLPTSASLPRAPISAFTASTNSQVTGQGRERTKAWQDIDLAGLKLRTFSTHFQFVKAWLRWNGCFPASRAKDTNTFFSIPPPLCEHWHDPIHQIFRKDIFNVIKFKQRHVASDYCRV